MGFATLVDEDDDDDDDDERCDEDEEDREVGVPVRWLVLL